MPTRLGLWLSNRLRWSRGSVRITPAGRLALPEAVSAQRVDALRRRFRVPFEARLPSDVALENYFYLELLARFADHLGPRWRRGVDVVDVGSKSFHYCAALHAALEPRSLTGVEVEGYRLFVNLHNRHDYAMAWIGGLPRTRYVVADIRDWPGRADLVTCFYPMVFADVHRAWGLPGSLFDPLGIYRAMRRLLPAGGLLLCVHQGDEEADEGCRLAQDAGFSRLLRLRLHRPLLERPDLPVLCAWQAD